MTDEVGSEEPALGAHSSARCAALGARRRIVVRLCFMVAVLGLGVGGQHEHGHGVPSTPEQCEAPAEMKPEQIASLIVAYGGPEALAAQVAVTALFVACIIRLE